jgi:hypothetical protein
MLSSLSPINSSPVTLLGTLAAMSIIVFFGMLVQKELVSARSRVERFKLLGQVLVIGIAPLLIVLILVLIKNFAQFLR